MSIKHSIKKLPGVKELARLRIHLLPPLYKSLPLLSPLSVHIEPTNKCNLRCSFCPTGDPALLARVNRPSGFMDVAVFQKICHELSLMTTRGKRKLDMLHLYKDGEPLLHRDIIKMIRIAKQSAIARIVATTTNAILIDNQTALALINSGLDWIRISLKPREYYASKEQFDAVISNIRFLYQEKKRLGSNLIVQIQIIPELMEKHLGSQPILKALGAICDDLSCNNLMGWSDSGKKDFTLGKKPKRSMDNAVALHDVLVCPEPFSKLAVNWNGGVSVCCVDWSWGTLIGNVNKNTLDEIWNGEELQEFRMLHLEGMRGSIGACGDCQYVRGTPGFCMLDDTRKKLIPAYAKQIKAP